MAVSSALRGSLITPVTVVAPVFVAAALVFAACSSSRVDPINAKVDALFAEWNRADSPGCGVGVGREGAVVYEHGYGTANLELGVRITPESVFSAASISKQFTAMSILLLVQRGQVRPIRSGEDSDILAVTANDPSTIRRGAP